MDALADLLQQVNTKQAVIKKPAAKARRKDEERKNATKEKLQGSVHGVGARLPAGGPPGSNSNAAAGPSSSLAPGASGRSSHAPAAAAGAGGPAPGVFTTAINFGAGVKSVQPLPFRLRDAMQALQEAAKPITPAELATACGHDISTDYELAAQLREHERVRMLPSGSLRYRSQHENITGRTELLSHVREHPGTLIDEVDYSYPGLRSDVEALVAEERLYLFRQPHGPSVKDKDEGMALHPRDRMEVNVSDKVASLFLSTPLPASAMEMRSALALAHLPSALTLTASAKRDLKLEKGKKKKKARVQRVNLDKATNKHLPSLFMGAQPVNIDSR